MGHACASTTKLMYRRSTLVATIVSCVTLSSFVIRKTYENGADKVLRRSKRARMVK